MNVLKESLGQSGYRRCRFGLRALFLAVTVVILAIPVASKLYDIWHQHHARERFKADFAAAFEASWNSHLRAPTCPRMIRLKPSRWSPANNRLTRSCRSRKCRLAKWEGAIRPPGATVFNRRQHSSISPFRLRVGKYV